jgi:nucleotide-binding universal stress UspA family protein
MEAILLPTDFSATAKNAALYALRLADQLGVKKIVLYHSYEIPITMDPMAPGIMEMYDTESLKKDSEIAMEDFKLSLKAFKGDINLDTVSEFGAIAEGLDEVCEDLDIGLIVMGITGGSFMEEKLIGSNTLSVAKHTSVPVIIVPKGIPFLHIKKIMLLSDFEKADTTIPVESIKKIVTETKAKLIVFNVEEQTDEFGVMYPANVIGESYAMHTLLKDLDPEYHFSESKNFMEAVNDFALDNMIDLIITVPKAHNFFANLFLSNHTKTLAFHSHIPLMVVHK